METPQHKAVVCKYCNKEGLFWSYDFRKARRILICLEEKDIHDCSSQEDIRPASCMHCQAKDLVWVRKNTKFELTESYGLQHTCDVGREYYLAWKEAKRINYAFEKAYLENIEDGTICKKCKGLGTKHYARSNHRWKSCWCKYCKGIGIYGKNQKKWFLKQLRKKYWPWKPGGFK